MEIERQPYDFYCQICQACGHDGCCNFIQCYSKLISLHKGEDECQEGEGYLKDARMYFNVAQLGEEIINKLENKQYDAGLAVQEFRKEWDVIYNKIYEK